MAYPVTVVKKGKPVIVWLGPDSVVPKPTNKFDAEGRASIFNVLPSYLWFIRGVQKGAKVDRHDGWDLAVTNCQPIYSPFDGIVVKAKASLDPKTGKGYGYYVDIKHTLKNGEEVITRYAHMRPQWVQLKQYQPVKAGQIVGFTSDYGAPGHYHLHFEVHQGGHIIQPSEYFYIPKTKEEDRKSVV